jgi:hypothetical protein
MTTQIPVISLNDIQHEKHSSLILCSSAIYVKAHKLLF